MQEHHLLHESAQVDAAVPGGAREPGEEVVREYGGALLECPVPEVGQELVAILLGATS